MGAPVKLASLCMSDTYIERILRARVYDVAMESPLETAPRLSRRIGNSVLLKREDLQPVFSFKLRGAYNKIAHLSDSVAKRGVICASAGNHAQGVALAAKRRGIPAIIVMPQTTPNIKVSAVRDLGGEVVLHGDDYDSAYEHAQSIVRERNLAFVHPVRRSGRDRGAGHRGRGDPASVARRDGRDLRAGRRRRTHRRHRRLCQVPEPAHQDHRRRAGGCRGHARFAARQETRDARASGSIRRRRRGAPRRRGNLPSVPRARRRNRAGRHRRNLRRHPGHLRRHALHRRARRARLPSRASRNIAR